LPSILVLLPGTAKQDRRERGSDAMSAERSEPGDAVRRRVAKVTRGAAPRSQLE
jgi:hypothetical protein